MFQTWFQREVLKRLDSIDKRLSMIQTRINAIDAEDVKMAGELDTLEERLTDMETVDEGVETLMSTLTTELSAAIAAGDLTRVAAINDRMKADTDKLKAALIANTPVDPNAPAAPSAPSAPVSS